MKDQGTIPCELLELLLILQVLLRPAYALPTGAAQPYRQQPPEHLRSPG